MSTLIELESSNDDDDDDSDHCDGDDIIVCYVMSI